MIILGIDVETTGLDSSKDQVVELGAVLFNTTSNRVIASFGKIYKVEVWGEEAFECHQISRELSNSMPLVGSEKFDPWGIVSGDMAKYIIAHNAMHDYPFVTKIWPSFKNKPWLCSKEGLLHSQKVLFGRVASTRLAHLCVDYHIQIGSWHQAVADAEACARLAACHDLDEAYERKMTPKFRLLANGGRIPDQKELLWKAPSVVDGIGGKYRWNPDIKSWWKEYLETKYVELDAEYIKKVMRKAKPKWSFKLEQMDPPTY